MSSYEAIKTLIFALVPPIEIPLGVFVALLITLIGLIGFVHVDTKDN